MEDNMKKFSLEEYLKNPNREVVTRDGRKVRVLCTDRKNYDSHPIIALVETDEDDERVGIFKIDGKWSVDGLENSLDLFFAPEKHEGWIIINKWPDGVRDTNGIIYHTKSDIPDMSPVGVQRVATIKIEWEE